MTARARLRTLAAGTFAVLAFTGCHPGAEDSVSTEAAAEALQEALAPREVHLITPEVRQESPTLDLVGEVRPFDTVTVAAEVSGTVDEVMVEVGDRVRRSEPLVQVDRESYRLRLQQAEADVAAAQADLRLAEKELERKRDLRSDETIPQAVLDQAEAAHDLARARLTAAEASRELASRDYAKSVVQAPAGGAVSARHVVAGQWVDVGTGLVDLAIGDRVKVSARVPEGWVANLQGLEGFDFSVGTGGKRHHASIYSVEPVVQQASRSFEVVGTARVDDPAVRPGRFATVTLTTPEPAPTLWLPATAVATSDLPQVYTVADGRLIDHKVQTGRRDDGSIEIVSGLTATDEVVADVAGLHRGIPVTVVE